MRDNRRQFFIGVVIFILVVVGGIVLRFVFGRQDSIEFNNNIIDLNNEVSEQISELEIEIRRPEVERESLDKRREEALAVAETNFDELRNLEVPNNGQELYDSSINLFSFYVDVLENNYITVIAIRTNPNFNTDESLQISLLEELGKIVNTQQEVALDFLEAQERFAEEEGLTLDYEGDSKE